MRVTGHGDGAWMLNALELGDVTLLHGVDGAPVLYRGAPHPAHFGVYLSLPGSHTELDGQRLGEDCFTWLAPRVELQGFTRVPARFLAIDLAERLLLQQAAQVDGLDVTGLYRTGTRPLAAAIPQPPPSCVRWVRWPSRRAPPARPAWRWPSAMQSWKPRWPRCTGSRQ
ncbi:hypothetical protein ACIGHF_01850 [Stenotrophomonas sp. NPDC077464]|uniref:hypothetical protein n=1 Tax=unclassified Stenotrophomonas TaxID=196198 RepID=UPI0037CFA7D0